VFSTAVHAQSKRLKIFEFPLDSGCINTFLTSDATVVRVTVEQEYDDVKPTDCYPESVVAKKVVVPSPPIVLPCPTKRFSVHFDFDKSKIKPAGNITLDELITYLKSCQNKADIIVSEGHCDNRGSDTYNLKLGMRRAKAVAAALVILGIDKNKIQIQSFGESQSTGNHAFDRRVDIIVNP